MLHTKISYLVSKLILRTKICNVLIYVTHETIMYRVRTYVTSRMCNVRTYATHKYEIIRLNTNLFIELYIHFQYKNKHKASDNRSVTMDKGGAVAQW